MIIELMIIELMIYKIKIKMYNIIYIFLYNIIIRQIKC